MPGKRRTAAFKARLSQDFDPVILDHRIGEKLFAGGLERRLGPGAILAADLDVEHLALSHTADALDAERLQRALDGLALRIEHAGFERYGDAGFHQFLKWRSPAKH